MSQMQKKEIGFDKLIHLFEQTSKEELLQLQ